MSANEETVVSAEETEEVEVVESTSDGEPGETRTIHVYGAGGEDFRIEIPLNGCVTFGYFNPASPRQADDFGRAQGNVARQTALRVYEGPNAKTRQIGCFIGVLGFRDISIKRVQIRKHVVIETQYEDDGRNENYGRKQQRMLVQANEDEEIPF